MSVVSFDLWGTLIKSSPSFTDAKVELIAKHFNRHKYTDRERILKAFSDTKKQLNDVIEITGWQPSRQIIWELFSYKLQGGYGAISDENLMLFIDAYQALSMTHHPVLYSDETLEYVQKFAQDNVLMISSNTMFMEAYSLMHTLQKLGLTQFFSKMLFSDLKSVSKPNPIMIEDSTFHIGDNLLTDGVVAMKAKIIPYIINSNGKTIKDAYNFFTQNR